MFIKIIPLNSSFSVKFKHESFWSAAGSTLSVLVNVEFFLCLLDFLCQDVSFRWRSCSLLLRPCIHSKPVLGHFGRVWVCASLCYDYTNFFYPSHVCWLGVSPSLDVQCFPVLQWLWSICGHEKKEWGKKLVVVSCKIKGKHELYCWAHWKQPGISRFGCGLFKIHQWM